MAEKPRLKQTNEIFGSLPAEPSRASKAADSPARPASKGGQERRSKTSEAKLPEPDMLEEEQELSEPQLPSAQDLAKKLLPREDRNPLDFSKYELPKRGRTTDAQTAPAPQAASPAPQARPAPPAAAPAPVPQDPQTARPDPRAAAPAPRIASPAASSPAPVFEQAPAAQPVVMEYTFESFEEEEDNRAREFETDRAESPPPEPERPPRGRPRRRASGVKTEAARTETEFELESAFSPEPEPKAEPRRAASPAPPAPEQNPEPDTKKDDDSPEHRRQEFLNRISSQFERQFEERFEDGLNPRDLRKNDPAPQRPRPAQKPEPGPVKTETAFPDQAAQQRREPEPPTEEDFLAMVQRLELERQERGRQDRERTSSVEPARNMPAEEPGASDFIARFEQDVRKEEERRSEDFKETLAEKFMRERERYLKELGFTAESEEPEEKLSEEQAPRTRRKLDFQIQPEMHVNADERPSEQRGPVTYTRNAVARPQVSEPDDVPDAPKSAAAPKKTSEELLMDLARYNRTASLAAPRKPERFKFKIESPEAQPTTKKKEKKRPLLPKEKWPRRIVIISMISGLLAIGLLVWPIVSYMRLSGSLAGMSEISVPESRPVVEDTLSVYNNMDFSQTAEANNVVFKKAGLTLRNVDVNDYVIIEGIESKGKIRLEDMTVGSAVSIKSCGIDTLELHNVKAERVIINNSTANVTVSATGSTDVGVVEIRTPASVRQTDITGEAPGVRGILLTEADSGGSVSAKLDGLSLRTLETEAPESVLVFENGTRAETMSSGGSLSLTGSGKVVSLAIGAKVGQGAGDFEDKKDISLIVSGVDITNLNLKSSANLNISSNVDNVYTSDNMSVGGEGSIGSFTLNPGPEGGRLLADIAGVNIQSLYSNTQSRVNITGSARVNTLTADQSTYALGNKVNHLIVNADGVIYENEPDRTTVAAGIRPPQSKAENPNLDYNVGTVDLLTDVSGEDFATTCGHSRESGGYQLGNGSKDDPYEVSSPAQLAHVAVHSESHFIQNADISVASDGKFASGFTMIGSAASPFAGVYDGGGFAITDLRIVSPDESVGLFGVNKGTIRNVRIVSGSIGSTSDSLAYVGGIAGLNIDGGSIRSCSNGASVSGGRNAYAGGIAGYNFNARIHDCYNRSKISGNGSVGGIVGMNSRSSAVTGSYNAGIVEGEGNVGAVAGKNEDATIANCYYLMDASDFGIGSGSGTAIDKTAEELMAPQMAADLTAGNEDSLWIPGETSTGGYHYPMHRKPGS